jgi:hypothetical protein
VCNSQTYGARRNYAVLKFALTTTPMRSPFAFRGKWVESKSTGIPSNYTLLNKGTTAGIAGGYQLSSSSSVLSLHSCLSKRSQVSSASAPSFSAMEYSILTLIGSIASKLASTHYCLRHGTDHLTELVQQSDTHAST